MLIISCIRCIINLIGPKLNLVVCAPPRHVPLLVSDPADQIDLRGSWIPGALSRPAVAFEAGNLLHRFLEIVQTQRMVIAAQVFSYEIVVCILDRFCRDVRPYDLPAVLVHRSESDKQAAQQKWKTEAKTWQHPQ